MSCSYVPETTRAPRIRHAVFGAVVAFLILLPGALGLFSTLQA